nr:hypothetical protein Iba_chr10dCG14460 [Ipomoea batatas]
MSLSSLLCSVSSSSTPDSSRRRQLWLRIFSSHGSFSGEIKETKSGLKMGFIMGLGSRQDLPGARGCQSWTSSALEFSLEVVGFAVMAATLMAAAMACHFKTASPPPLDARILRFCYLPC